MNWIDFLIPLSVVGKVAVMSEKIELPAVKKIDLESILSRFELTEQMNAGQLPCAYCGQSLTWDNLGALVVKNKNLVLYCNLAECIDAAAKGVERA